MKNTYTPAEALRSKIEFKERVLVRLNAMQQTQLPDVKNSGVSPDHLLLGKKLFKEMVAETSESFALEFKDTFSERLSLAHYGRLLPRDLKNFNETLNEFEVIL